MAWPAFRDAIVSLCRSKGVIEISEGTTLAKLAVADLAVGHTMFIAGQNGESAFLVHGTNGMGSAIMRRLLAWYNSDKSKVQRAIAHKEFITLMVVKDVSGFDIHVNGMGSAYKLYD
eukprot:7882674-Ditylum_brightwellii.AAC.2